ncbi:hypothetical protein EQH57_0083 [Dictyocoela roeselum]|nr:hypothetical protein EQH57_0083 [Dictyocoela roeselum]
MTPENALLDKNRDEVIKISRIYKKEFKSNVKPECFKIGEKVLIKNETRKNKMEKEFNKLGVIKSKVGNNAYNVKFPNNKVLLRHTSQLRGWPGDVGCQSEMTSKDKRFFEIEDL